MIRRNKSARAFGVVLFLCLAAVSAVAQCEKLSTPKLQFSSKQMLKRLEYKIPIAIPVAARVQGTVVARVYLNSDGTVECVQVVSGPPVLADPVRASVSKWRFRSPKQKAIGDLYIIWNNGWTQK